MCQPLRIELTIRNSDDLQRLNLEIESLKSQLAEKEREIYRLGLMVSQSISYIDMINRARDDLKAAGLDYSYLKLR